MNQTHLIDLIKSLDDEETEDALQFLGLKRDSNERSNRDSSE